MNLRFVESFYWVATLKSVTRAAERLFITQSAMSARIAALEEELGVLLLDRRDKQFRLTVAGSRFVSWAEQLLELQRKAKGEMGIGNLQPVSLRLGAIESVLHSWLIPWIEQLQVMQPDVELELTVETSPVLLDQVRRGTLDIVFAAMPAAGEGIRARALAPMEMVFVGHAELHRKRRYGLAQLAEGELLTFQRGSQPHVALLDLLRQHGIEPRRVHAISSISAMTQLVNGGFGIATLPRAALEGLAGVHALKRLVCEVALAPLPIYVSWRREPTSGTVDAVIRSLLDRAGAEATRRT